jgi:hypothetical protein
MRATKLMMSSEPANTAGILFIARGDEISKDPQACPDDRADDAGDQPLGGRDAEKQRLHGAEFSGKEFAHARIISPDASKLVREPVGSS